MAAWAAGSGGADFFLGFRPQEAPTAMARALESCRSPAGLLKDIDLSARLGIALRLKLNLGPYMLASPASGTPARCNQ